MEGFVVIQNTKTENDNNIIITEDPSAVINFRFQNSTDKEYRNSMENFYSKRSKYLTQLFKGPSESSPKSPELHLENWHYVIVVQNPELADDSLEVPVSEMKGMYKNCFLANSTNKSLRSNFSRHSEISAFCSACMKEDKILLKDYIKTINNVILVKLVGSLGLKVRQILSSCGRYIFLVIHASDEIIGKEAEFSNYQKELDLAFVDLHSLHPCDEKLRPFFSLLISDETVKELQEKLLEEIVDSSEKTNDDCLYQSYGLTLGHIENYKVYLKALLKKIDTLKVLDLDPIAYRVAIQKAMTAALAKANRNNPEFTLKNLWGRLDIRKPCGPFMKFTQRDNFHWKTFKVSNKTRSPFSNMERIRLLYTYIHHYIALYELKERGLIVQHFPLHNYYKLKNRLVSQRGGSLASSKTDELNSALIRISTARVSTQLISAWKIKLFNLKIPLNKIKNYFGEKIAFYFEFLRVFQRSLLLPSIVGTIAIIFEFTLSDHDVFMLIVRSLYSIFIVVWGVFFLEYWSKREKNLAIIWGQTAFKEIEINRPQFKGIDMRSPVTDNMETKYFPVHKKIRRYFQSFLISFLMLMLVITTFCGIVFLRWVSTETLKYNSIDFASVLSAFINAIMIQIYNYFYSKINKKLTELENHKSQTSYDTSLILKTYIFQFFNSFGPLLYIAFFKSSAEGCVVWNGESFSEKTVGASCLSELNLYLFAIFIVCYLSNIVEVGLPMLKYRLKRQNKVLAAQENGDLPIGTQEIKTEIEKMMMEDMYLNGEDDGTIDDFLELVELFGYITLFAVALPIAGLLCYIGLWIEMHSDKFKVLYLLKRPVPLGANRIGIWWNILDFINFLSVFTNAGVICFTESGFRHWEYAQDNIFLIYGLFVSGLLLLLIVVKYVAPTEDSKYQVMKQRHDFLVERMLLNHDETDIFNENEIVHDIDYIVIGGRESG